MSVFLHLNIKRKRDFVKLRNLKVINKCPIHREVNSPSIVFRIHDK